MEQSLTFYVAPLGNVRELIPVIGRIANATISIFNDCTEKSGHAIIPRAELVKKRIARVEYPSKRIPLIPTENRNCQSNIIYAIPG